MQRSSLAPLLSATLSTVSCWIISPRLLDDFGDAPALLLGQGSRLDDAHAVADAAGGSLVMRLVAACVPYYLLVQGMRFRVPHEHDHRLLHLAADHDALAHLATRARVHALRRLTHRPSPLRSHPRQIQRAATLPALHPRRERLRHRQRHLSMRLPSNGRRRRWSEKPCGPARARAPSGTGARRAPVPSLAHHPAAP